MSVQVIDTLKPKNGLDFPVVEAIDVAVEGYDSLADAVTHFATDAMMDTIIATLATKASTSDLAITNAAVESKADKTTTDSLQGQIDQIVISASSESVVAPEVAAARVSLDGTSYNTLKARIDASEENAKMIDKDQSEYFILTNKYTKSFKFTSGSAHSSNNDRVDVNISEGDTVKITLKNDASSSKTVAVFAKNSNNESARIATTNLSGTITFPAADNYISIGLAFDTIDVSGTAVYNIEVFKGGQKREFALRKSDLTEGSLQTASMKASAYDSAFCYLTKIPLTSLLRLKIVVPAVEGVYYKYRYGFYRADESYDDQISLTTSNVVNEKNNCYYLSFGVYAYNESDDSAHSNILSEYTDDDVFILQYQDEFVTEFIPLDNLPRITNSEKAIDEIGTDLSNLEWTVNSISEEIANARTFSEYNYSDYITEGYYLAGTTGQPVKSSSSSFAKIPCLEGDQFIVDFGGTEKATPLFSADSSGKSTEIFVNFNEHPTEPVQVTIDSGMYLVANFTASGRPLIKKYQLGGGGSDDSIVGLNKGFEDYAIQAMRRINLSGNAYLNAPQPFSLMHFSDIHGDAAELNRMKEFYDKFKNYFDDAICSGDLVSLRYTSDFTYWNWDEVLLAIGNHDVLADPSGWDWSIRATQQEQYEKYFASNIGNWNVTYDEGKTYYYKDYAAKSIRLIVLNSMLTGSDNENQRTWFVDTLTDAITSDLYVIVVNHYPVRNFVKLNCNFTTLDKTSNNEAAVNMDAYQADIESFKTGGGKFICWVAGHTHFDLIGYNSDYPTQYCICVDALSREQGNQYSDTQRTNNTKSQDLANMFVVDTTSSIVKLIRIGADKDHYLRSKKSITLNYATGAVITSD